MNLRPPGPEVPAARLAAAFARVGTLVLVTGTNGKSTTAHLIEQIWGLTGGAQFGKTAAKSV